MQTIGEALAAIMGAISPLDAEPRALADALGSVLAEPILAREDAPPFDASAMDGWAVRARDLATASDTSPVALETFSESRAGGPPPPELPAARAMRIFTGAPLPPGANAVVLQEIVDHVGDRARFSKPVSVGTDIRRRGSDLEAGSPLLSSGTVITSGEIALLASQDLASISVHRTPVVAILTNGDELRGIGEPIRPGSIVDSNGPAIAAAVREAGAIPRILERAPDVTATLVARVREGLEADALILCGGVSVGDHDLVHVALERAGVSARFWKVAVKPGKPLTFGLAGKTPVFGLPGNPVSAWVTFQIFVRPALRRMMGDPRPYRQPIDVVLATDHKHAPGRTELARARLTYENGKTIAHLSPKQGSGSIQSIADVDALVILPADRVRFATGEPLRAIPLLGQRARVSPFE